MRLVHRAERFLVVDKPAGLPFHQDAERPGVLQRLRALMEAGAFPPVDELFPVHRLDAVTSGLLLLACDAEAASALGEEFARRCVDKVYVALSQRRPKKKQGWVVGDMVRSRRGSWKLTRTQENPARTRFLSVALPESRSGMRLYWLKPETGKTHQLRVALKSLGAPILGDPLYGQAEEAAVEERTYLHACALRFSLDGEVHEFCEPPTEGCEFLSEAFVEEWSRMANVWELFRS